MNGLPQDRIPVLRVPATPAHVNWGGDIFGGWIMSQVDIAGSIPAVIRAQGRVVTVAVKELVFLKPVVPGDIVSLYADVVDIGRSSITVTVAVYAQRDSLLGEAIEVCAGTVVYVAVDDDGKPRGLPPVGQ